MSSEEDTGSENSYDSEEVVEEPPKPTRKRTKNGKDPNKPKRNMSAFFLYSNANRNRVKEENPGIKFGRVVSTNYCFRLASSLAVEP